MDWQTGFDVVLGIAAAALGYMMRKVDERTEATQRDLAQHKVKVAEVYVTRTEVSEGFQTIYDKLDKISDKLDKKADR